MKRTSLAIVAYKCRICEKRKNEDLLTMEEEIETNADFHTIIKEYAQDIKKSQLGKNSNRTIRLSSPLSITNYGDWTKYSIYTKAGKLGEDFDVFNWDTKANVFYPGSVNSAMYAQRTYCFFNNKTKENIFIFFRYGSGGCKTAFEETLNQFLSTKNLVARFDLQMSGKMFDQAQKYFPEKLHLITNYTPTSSDAADNIKKRKKQTEREVIIYLDSPNARGLRGWFLNGFRHNPTLDELKSITVQDNFGQNFDEAYITLKFGKVVRKIKIQDFTGTIAEYDITDKVEYYENGKKFIEESLDRVVDEYAFSFFDN